MSFSASITSLVKKILRYMTVHNDTVIAQCIHCMKYAYHMYVVYISQNNVARPTRRPTLQSSDGACSGVTFAEAL